jgi:hypothetical protein
MTIAPKGSKLDLQTDAPPGKGNLEGINWQVETQLWTLWFGRTSVFQASINSGACRQQHRLQREQNLLFYAIPGKKLQSVYISPSVPHYCADPQRPPVERRRVFNLHFGVDCQLDPCEDGPPYLWMQLTQLCDLAPER